MTEHTIKKMQISDVIALLESHLLQNKPFLKELNMVVVEEERKKQHVDAVAFLKGLRSSLETYRKEEVFSSLKEKVVEMLEPIEHKHTFHHSQLLYRKLAQ